MRVESFVIVLAYVFLAPLGLVLARNMHLIFQSSKILRNTFLFCACATLLAEKSIAELTTASPDLAKPGSPENPIFYIQEYRIKGATKISNLEVEESVYPYLGPARTTEDVEKARQSLEKAYHDKGFQTVSVLIPQQNPRQGIIILEVVEGTVGRLRVNGANWYLPSKIKAASPSMAEGSVPNMNDVQRDILALNRLSDRRVTPELKPGSIPGTFDIDLNVEDKIPLHGSVELNNRYSPNTSELRLNAGISYANIFQLGHTIGFSGQIAPENPDDALVYSGYYLARLSDKLSLLLSAVRQDSDISTLGGGSVIGMGEIYTLRALFDMPSADNFYQSFGIGLDWKSFGEDLLVGDENISAPIEYYPLSANYGASWLQGEDAFTELNSSLLFNLRGLGSDRLAYDRKRFGANGSFVVIKSDLSHTHDLEDESQLFVKIQSQLSDKPLINTEQYSGGGLSTARGYYESTALGDNALFLTGEYRSKSLFGKSTKQQPLANELRFHTFVDAGALHIYDALPGQASHTYLLSAGVGSRLRYKKNFNSSLDIAFPLNSVSPAEQGDIRVTFRGWIEY